MGDPSSQYHVFKVVWLDWVMFNRCSRYWSTCTGLRVMMYFSYIFLKEKDPPFASVLRSLSLPSRLPS